MTKESGMNYAPKGGLRSQVVCQPGEFMFAAYALDHGHIGGMCQGLVEAGGQLKWVYDADETKAAQFAQRFPGAQVARSMEEILLDSSIKLVASAAIPSKRCEIGLQVMAAGKDYFADKAPFTSLEQLELARAMAQQTGRKYAVYYCERLHSECAVYAGQLIEQGAIGRVIQVLGLGPHRMSAPHRPAWFFEKEAVGGILCDIGSHQVEQFLYYTGAKDARLAHSKVANYNHTQYPGFEDYGDATFIGDNGATGYFRVDWFTPDGLSTWGDGRTTILGTEGYIELRKYVDIGRQTTGDHLYLVNAEGEHYIDTKGTVGFPYFGQLILDCLNRTEHAMTQEHAFKAAELSLIAQRDAVVIVK